MGGKLAPFKDWAHEVDLGAEPNAAAALPGRALANGGMTRAGGATNVSDGALAFAHLQDRLNRGAMHAAYTPTTANNIGAPGRATSSWAGSAWAR